MLVGTLRAFAAPGKVETPGRSIKLGISVKEPIGDSPFAFYSASTLLGLLSSARLVM